MALSPRVQAGAWLAVLAVFLAVLWFLGDVLLPFVIGMAIAYLLDPVADRLQGLGLSRLLATLVITLVALVVLLAVIAVLVPLLIEQLAALFAELPVYLQEIQRLASAHLPDLVEVESLLAKASDSLIPVIRSTSGDLAGFVLASAVGVADALIIAVVAPVVAVYMLLDWDRMVATVDGWLPRDHRQTIRTLARDVDAVLASFVRGQLSVCGILAIWYAIALMVVGLKFGLVVGVLAGMLTFIPYVGAIIGGVLSIGIAVFQFWDDPIWIGVVAAIFVIGQLAEGNVLTPKLVGGSVGLHPVWLMFALSALGSMFGFTGLLVAVPIAAAVGVFSRFGLRQYLGGRLYRGTSDSSP
ncbi:MAG: AI-2E family transporter [Paracoccaceae bacterium]|nr:AI-2E family transporter [Paracoccaceae bacterium]MDE2912754.1 AI-2E family transporter [Paracoccaceae bacterium]